MAKNTPDQEDIDLFRQTVGKVTPVKNDRLDIKTKNKPKPTPKPSQIDFKENFLSDKFHDTRHLSNEDRMSYLIPGLQNNVLKKLRKGYFGISSELDLHGLTSAASKKQLLQFLYFSVEDGARCVRIIHGKGYRSSDNYPVLKNNLNLWLRQHQDVLAFCSAPAWDGGTGAVYVLLRLAPKYREQEDAEE